MLQGLWHPPLPPNVDVASPRPPCGVGWVWNCLHTTTRLIRPAQGPISQKLLQRMIDAWHPVSQAPPEDNVPGEAPE